MNSKHGVGNYISIVEPDDVPNPTGIAPQPYAYPGWPGNMLAPPPTGVTARTDNYAFAPPQPSGPYGAVATNDGDKTIKFILWGIAMLAVYLLIIRPAIKKNPGIRKRSAVARVVGSDGGGFFWKLLRKNAKKHGPYATKGDARGAAQCKGHRVIR